MREQLPKIIILLLLVAIVGLPILLRPAEGGSASDGRATELIVYTPHNEQIRYEIERAFRDWRKRNDLPPVDIVWLTPGGTSDIRKSILSQYQALYGSPRGLDEGIGVDLFFGGGPYDHGKIAGGLEVTDDQGNQRAIRIVMDPELDPALKQSAFPQPMIGGEQLYREFTFQEPGTDGTVREVEIIGWTGVTLSSFGIVYNNDVLEQLGLDKPTVWRDLGQPAMRGWVALADPGHSGSISATFDAILRREGWTEGWRTLRMMYANARYFANDASRVPVDVSRGDAAAGLCIDFYGRYQAGAIGDNRVGYTDPVADGKSMTATTADPITLLRGAPKADLAREFIAWLLTPEAQHLWQRATADKDDGLVRPERYELRRQPIRVDLYTDEQKAQWVDRGLDPFATAVPFPEGTPNYFAMIAPVTKAMAIDIHHDLVAAWQALIKARETNHPNRQQMERLFFAMPEQLVFTWSDDELAEQWRAIHYDPDHPRHSEVVAALQAFEARLDALGDMDASRVRWRSFFQDNYREVVRLGK